MKKLLSLLFFLPFIVTSQVTISPVSFDVDQSITITVDTNSSATDCNGFNNPTKVYMHSGIGDDSNAWGFGVVGNWGKDDGFGEMTNNNDGTWSITIVPEAYYGLTATEAANATQMGMVFRNENGSQEFKENGCTDFFFNVGSFQLTLTSPAENLTVLNSGQSLSISATTSKVANFVLKANGTIINTSNNSTSYNFNHTNITENTSYVLEATNSGTTQSKTFQVVVNMIEQPVPNGMKDGINLDPNNNTKATLVLFAPGKDVVHLLGDFNNWQVDNNYLLKKDSSKDRFWIELTGLTPQTNHMYQYLVDGSLRIADPYSTTILDEFNDGFINNTTYPNLPDYPSGDTNHAVTLLRTGDTPFNWQVSNFQVPAKTDLVIYELLIRDFDALHSFNAVKARLDYLEDLGVNAIEFLPVSEFDGNESWGYNPSFHMALDKYYGTSTAFKQFIDECHKRGMAVILDVVYNHATGQNPFYRMWNTDGGGYGGQASNDSPFFNPVATHSYSVFNDFNHSKQATKDYVKRTTQYWIDEYKIDGFRWDLTKGFTQNCTSSDEGCTGSYQADRVAVLKEYADYQWEKDSDFYVIFEHLGGNTEETEWVNYRLNEGKGIMVWGNHNSNYNEATMGYHDGGKSDFSWISYKKRGWTVPANVSYMESHDEERLMYRNLQYGNFSGSYSIKSLPTALDRMEMAGAFYFTVPGPKMIWQFGELGYDISIEDPCRVCNKPILWNYFSEPDRKDLYDEWTKLIQLKKEVDIFRTDNFSLDVNKTSGLKKIQLTDDAANPEMKYITIIGNFGVTTQSINPTFQKTGTWYDLLNDNQSINVTNINTTISLQPGEFKVYGSSEVTLAVGENEKIIEGLVLYPNPAKGNFVLNKTVQNIEIYDLLGRKVKSFSGNFNSFRSFDVSSLKASIYLVKIRSDFGTSTRRLVIE
jgi:pullulanase/glycogen debranching enzyme